MKSDRLAAESVAFTKPVHSAFDLVSLVAPFAVVGRGGPVQVGNAALKGNSARQEDVAAEAVVVPLPAIGA